MSPAPLWRRYDRLSGSDPAADVKDELRFHLETKVDDLVAQGWSRDEARKEAEREFGNILAVQSMGEHIGEHMDRRRRLTDHWADALRDLRFTLRSLRRDTGFTIVAILILTLAIGANVAVFSVLNTLLLRPLPFPNADQLVWIAPPPTKCGQSCATFSTDAYDAFRKYTRSFQDVTGYFAFSSPGNLSLNRGGSPIPATSIDVIANFFQVLGVQPAMGRTFRPEDGVDGAAPVILLSDAWWKTQFSRDPAIIGKTFDINGKQTTVIGVLPKGFDFGAVFSPGAKVDAITPFDLYGPPRGWGNNITMIGRMRPGVTIVQAQGDSAAAAPHMCWSNTIPQSCGSYAAQKNGTGGVVPVSLKDHVTGRLSRSLVVLWCAVGAILLIACVNLSNLLLARAAARSKEFALRGALGASRARIVAQLLTESLALSAVGAVFGLGLASLLVTWLAHQQAVALPLLTTLHIDGAALGWTVLMVVFVAGISGILPGLRMAGGNLQESLKDSGPGAGQSRKQDRIRSVLVVTEVALACVLLVGAGLLLHSFMNVLSVDLGFEPSRTAAIQVDYNDSAPTPAGNAEKRGVIFQQVIARVSRIPGVEAAGISDYLPLGQNRSWGMSYPKGVKPPDNSPDSPLVYVVSPGYLRAMGTRFEGRDFTWDDGPKSEQVVMIDRDLARYYARMANWPNGSAIGQLLDAGNGNVARIVGIVDPIHEESTDGAMGWQMYFPITQATPTGAQLVVRSQQPPSYLASSVLGALRELNPKQTAAEFRPIQMLVDHANSPRRLFLVLVGSFAVLGLLLAAIGIYGVISYSVTQRTQEIGVRMALGATMGQVQRDVILKTLRLALMGIALGTIASLLASKAIAALLFGVAPTDLIAFAGTVLLLEFVAVLAGYIPARRASRISPMVALRSN
jgi:predicted permease